MLLVKNATENGIFISFKDNTSGNYDVYGQYLEFDGDLIFDLSGVAIASGANDQQSSTLAYNQDQNEVLIYHIPCGKVRIATFSRFLTATETPLITLICRQKT